MERPRVLIVDPDLESRALVEKVLGKHCDLIFQDDPTLTLDALENFEPDLLIMELELQVLGGFQFLDVLQSDPVFRGVPIMIFSARRDVESQKLAYRLGAMHFQTKPCQPSQLFKGAAMFARLAGGKRPAKKFALDEARRRLAERESAGQMHPLLAQAIAVHGRMKYDGRDHPVNEKTVLASVAGGRPVEPHPSRGPQTK